MKPRVFGWARARRGDSHDDLIQAVRIAARPLACQALSFVVSDEDGSTQRFASDGRPVCGPGDAEHRLRGLLTRRTAAVVGVAHCRLLPPRVVFLRDSPTLALAFAVPISEGVARYLYASQLEDGDAPECPMTAFARLVQSGIRTGTEPEDSLRRSIKATAPEDAAGAAFMISPDGAGRMMLYMGTNGPTTISKAPRSNTFLSLRTRWR